MGDGKMEEMKMNEPQMNADGREEGDGDHAF